MNQRFGMRMARTAGVAIVCLLLIAGGAFAARGIATSSPRLDQLPAAATSNEANQASESPDPTGAGKDGEVAGEAATEPSAEPSDSPEATDGNLTQSGGDDDGASEGGAAEDGGSGDQGGHGASNGSPNASDKDSGGD